MKAIQKGDGFDLELDEFELHDLLADMSNMGSPEGDAIDEIRIVPRSKKFSPELVAKWNILVNELNRQVKKLDSEFHEDAEFTC